MNSISTLFFAQMYKLFIFFSPITYIPPMPHFKTYCSLNVKCSLKGHVSEHLAPEPFLRGVPWPEEMSHCGQTFEACS